MHPDYTVFLLRIGVRTAVVLFYLTAGLRVLGKRQVAQMNVYDFVLILALGNAVQNAMTMSKGELSVGIVSAGTLILLGRLFAAAFVRRPSLENRLIGTPTILIENGRIIKDHLHRECISDQQLMAALRAHGLSDPSEAKLAVLEVDGSLSVVPRHAPSHRSRRRFRALRLP